MALFSLDFGIYTIIRTLSTDAEEIAQQTFYRAMSSKSGGKTGSNEFSWLCTIAKNLIVDFYRHRKREVLKSDEIEDEPDRPEQNKSVLTKNFSIDSEPETHAIEQEDVFRIHYALHKLKEPYREVFELRVFGELSYRQISEIFGKTESWARVTYYRARVLLKERVKTDD